MRVDDSGYHRSSRLEEDRQPTTNPSKQLANDFISESLEEGSLFGLFLVWSYQA